MLSILLQAESSSGGSVSSGESYFGIERHVWAWGIGTGFALAAVLISVALIVQTYRQNPLPLIRRWVLLVLLMVPVYSICAWLGLVLKNQVREAQCTRTAATPLVTNHLTAHLTELPCCRVERILGSAAWRVRERGDLRFF